MTINLFYLFHQGEYNALIKKIARPPQITNRVIIGILSSKAKFAYIWFQVMSILPAKY
jgi:hypothetical protein